MSSRIRKRDGVEMVCTNYELPKDDHRWLAQRARRLGLAGVNGKTGVSRLIALELEKVIKDEKENHLEGNFHDDDIKPCVLVVADGLPTKN